MSTHNQSENLRYMRDKPTDDGRCKECGKKLHPARVAKGELYCGLRCLTRFTERLAAR